MVPSSSGPGRLVLIQKIAGSTPAGITTVEAETKGKSLAFFFCEAPPGGKAFAKQKTYHEKQKTYQSQQKTYHSL